MDLERLKEFIIIADEQSVRRAARRLSLSPSTLNSRMNVFERSLGITLFVRGQQSLTLTAEGARLYRSGTDLLEEYRQLVGQMEFVSSNTLRSLRIGIIGNEMPLHLGAYLDLVNLRSPDIRIDLLDEAAFSMESSLLSGEIDLCFGPVLTSFRHEEIVCQPIAPAHAGVLLPVTHPLAHTDTLYLPQLEGETFLLYPNTRCAALRSFQLDNLRDTLTRYDFYESDSSSRYLDHFVPMGKGLLFTPFHEPTHLPHCVRRPLTGVPHPAPDSILYLKNPGRKVLRTFVRDFMKYVRESSMPEYRKMP